MSALGRIPQPDQDAIEESYQYEVDIKDKSNPSSLVNLTPSVVANGILAIPDEVFLMSEEELEKAGHCKIMERRLRQSFWLEYAHATVAARKMNMANVLNGVMQRDQFYKHIVTNSFKLAYILTQPKSYKIETRDLLELGLSQMREILELPLYTKDFNGREVVDSKTAAVKVKVTEMILNRVQGDIIRHIKQDTRNLHIHKNADEKTPKSIAEIDAELAALAEQQNNQLKDVVLIEAPKEEETIIPKALPEVPKHKVAIAKVQKS